MGTDLVEFNVEAPRGSKVYVVGDFNSWDPFVHRMIEGKPGVYTTRIRTFGGVHSYYYLIDGRRSLDPLNPSYAADYEGFEVSRFSLP